MKEVVYQAGPSSHGFLSVWKEIFEETWGARGLVWRLFVRDLAARYRQSVLGYAWAFATPVATTVLFSFLREQNFFAIEAPQKLPYPLYVLFGLAVWQIFSGGLQATTTSLVASGNLVTKINFPREALVISSLGHVLFDVLLRFLLLAAVWAWYVVRMPESHFVQWTAVLVPICLLPLVLLTFGCGFLLSVLHALFRDTASALNVLLNLAFFLVPIVYPPPIQGAGVWLNQVNPVSVFWLAAHDVAVHGQVSHPVSLACASGASVILFFVGWRMFRLAQPLIAERI